MKYAIIGLGRIGTAIAQAFANSCIEVAVAGRRPVDSFAKKIGPAVIATTLEAALGADVIILAVPFEAVPDIAKMASSWEGKLVIDTTNAFGVPVEQLGGLPSSTVNAKALPGAKLVKAFNHLPASLLAQGPNTPEGGRRVVFISSDDDAASKSVASLVALLGFAPIELGMLAEGGALIQARGNTWTQLIFQDLVKFDRPK